MRLLVGVVGRACLAAVLASIVSVLPAAARAEVRELQCRSQSGRFFYVKVDYDNAVFTFGLIMPEGIQALQQTRARITDARISGEVRRGKQQTLYTLDRYAGTLNVWWTLTGFADDADEETTAPCIPFEGLPKRRF